MTTTMLVPLPRLRCLSMPFVAIKTVEEQDMQALHRMRAKCVKDRTSISNSTRGLLGEYGIDLTKGLATLRKSIPEVLSF